MVEYVWVDLRRSTCNYYAKVTSYNTCIIIVRFRLTARGSQFSHTTELLLNTYDYVYARKRLTPRVTII